MDVVVDGWQRERAARAMLPLFLLSGATGLIYQTVWSRQLHLVFGTSTLAIATVLAAFMGGLSLGGWLGGRIADRVSRPLRWYGLLEIGIGVWAVAFPWMLSGVTPLWVEASWHLSLDASGRAAVQWWVVFGLLLPPTAAMGATLPLLSRFVTERIAHAGARVGTLYALNTLGAVLGTGLAGFWMLSSLGLQTTTWVVAVANGGLGALALVLDGTSPPLSARQGRAVDGAVRSAAVVVAGLAGLAGLVAEVGWFRILALQLGASTYAFTVMLLAFLIGIAAGGAVGGRWGDARLARGGPAAVWDALAGTLFGVGVVTTGALYLSTWLPYIYVSLFGVLGAGDHPTMLWLVKLLLAAMLLFPSTFLMGVAFSLTVRSAVDRTGGVGGAVGSIYTANTAGGMLGAATAGFLFLPSLGVRGTLALSAAVYLGAALLALGGRGAVGACPTSSHLFRPLVAGTLSVALLWLAAPPRWDPLLVTAGMYKYAADLEETTPQAVDAFARTPYELLFYEEGAATVVTVARARRSGNVWLANNGKIEASTRADMPTQRLVALLPMMVAPRREQVGMVGLASGITAGAALIFEEIERLSVVELEPATARAARLFEAWNRGVMADPRLDLTYDDGRNFLLRTPPGSFDVIVSEPSNPWISGVSNLFTAEFFEMARGRLRPGGVWGQWVQLYGMGEEDVRTLLGTFADAFEYVEVWGAAEDADLVVLGSDRPIVPTPQRLADLFERPAIRHALADIEIDGPGDLLAYRRLDTEAVRHLSDARVRNTDDNMRIEYRAPRSLHRGTTLRNNRMLDRYQVMPVDVLGDDTALWVATARGLLRRGEHRFASEAFAHAALRMPPGTPERSAWLLEGFEAWMEGVEVPEAQRRRWENRFLAEVVQPILDQEGRTDR